MVKIVTYHYVRDKNRDGWKGLNVCPIETFKNQISWLKLSGEAISLEHLVAALRNDSDIPNNAFLLTFDDGYLDHYDTIFPILQKEGIKGVFFPSVQSACSRKLLVVNKIQLILSEAKAPLDILNVIQEEVRIVHGNKDFNIMPFLKNVASRFDRPETALIKSLLQEGLPEHIRDSVVDILFSKYVTKDENSLAEELYMNLNQLQEISTSGHYIGGHGSSHKRLTTLSEDQLCAEIEDSLKLVQGASGSTKFWCMCYPHGSVNECVCQALRDANCSAAFTIEARELSDADDILLIPRLDTRDIPN